MRALLKPDIARGLGIVLLKPGSELMSIFSSGRVLVERQPDNMAHLESGPVPEAHQPLAQDPELSPFLLDSRVIQAAGGITSLENWLLRRGGCQWPHSEYHHHELVTMRHEPGAIRLCWSCDNLLRDQSTRQLQAIAERNVMEWVIDQIRLKLRIDEYREVSLAELCWWAFRMALTDLLPEGIARRAFNLPPKFIQSVTRESDIKPEVTATSIMQGKSDDAAALRESLLKEPVKTIVNIAVDPEPPAASMSRPKLHRWRNAKFLRWVKTQPCQCCGQPADDAHHLIGWRQGGMGTKAHDFLTIPLCRIHHTELHNDPKAFERKYGTQPELIIYLLDRAFALGVLA
ncbi:DUF968 domain-containing protein [Atlantibacter hermannii]|uniref:DUF968 domain-containing protein n=1 Tax=Atlantibacter hermannii TaxID=565 RepID=UPI00289AF731|nr:DUF968 domain-containing protein [Atlantibacter hermannii]